MPFYIAIKKLGLRRKNQNTALHNWSVISLKRKKNARQLHFIEHTMIIRLHINITLWSR